MALVFPVIPLVFRSDPGSRSLALSGSGVQTDFPPCASFTQGLDFFELLRHSFLLLLAGEELPQAFGSASAVHTHQTPALTHEVAYGSPCWSGGGCATPGLSRASQRSAGTREPRGFGAKPKTGRKPGP